MGGKVVLTGHYGKHNCWQWPIHRYPPPSSKLTKLPASQKIRSAVGITTLVEFFLPFGVGLTADFNSLYRLVLFGWKVYIQGYAGGQSLSQHRRGNLLHMAELREKNQRPARNHTAKSQ